VTRLHERTPEAPEGSYRCDNCGLTVAASYLRPITVPSPPGWLAVSLERWARWYLDAKGVAAVDATDPEATLDVCRDCAAVMFSLLAGVSSSPQLRALYERWRADQ
jgi:hypothetical protein